jgi:glutaredoxin
LAKVVLYEKEGCHLCEDVASVLERLSRERPFEFSTKDITSDPELFERYKNVIPVVEVDGRVRLGGSTLSSSYTLENVLRRAIFQASSPD